MNFLSKTRASLIGYLPVILCIFLSVSYDALADVHNIEVPAEVAATSPTGLADADLNTGANAVKKFFQTAVEKAPEDRQVNLARRISAGIASAPSTESRFVSIRNAIAGTSGMDDNEKNAVIAEMNRLLAQPGGSDIARTILGASDEQKGTFSEGLTSIANLKEGKAGGNTGARAAGGNTGGIGAGDNKDADKDKDKDKDKQPTTAEQRELQRLRDQAQQRAIQDQLRAAGINPQGGGSGSGSGSGGGGSGSGGGGGDSGGGGGGGGKGGGGNDNGRGLTDKGLSHILDKLASNRKGNNNSKSDSDVKDALASLSKTNQRDRGIGGKSDSKLEPWKAEEDTPTAKPTPQEQEQQVAKEAPAKKGILPGLAQSYASNQSAPDFGANMGGGGGGGMGGGLSGANFGKGGAGGGGGDPGGLFAGGGDTFGGIGAADNYSPMKYNYSKFGEADFGGAPQVASDGSGGDESGDGAGYGGDVPNKKFNGPAPELQLVSAEMYDRMKGAHGIMGYVGRMVKDTCERDSKIQFCVMRKALKKQNLTIKADVTG